MASIGTYLGVMAIDAASRFCTQSDYSRRIVLDVPKSGLSISKYVHRLVVSRAQRLAPMP